MGFDNNVLFKFYRKTALTEPELHPFSSVKNFLRNCYILAQKQFINQQKKHI